MQITSKNSIIKYSHFAGAYLLIHANSNGQAVYTDIDPDISLVEDFDFANIDMDANGTLDFQFLNWSYYFTTSSYVLFQFRERIWAIAYSEPNAFAGSFDDTLYGARYYPYALENGVPVNNSLIFQDAFIQRMAFRTFNLSVSGSNLFDRGGNWYPEITDHYLGVKFIDTTECIHYGWIRCDVLDSGRTLIIKDYAYEIKCDLGVLAGDTVGDTTTVAIEEINSLIAKVYCFDNVIYINLDELINNVEIHIYDMGGKMIYMGEITNQSAQIELSEAKGIYFVELVDGENKFTKKVFIN
ncbi:MAG: T9SS type A sorting domain-containing protein [Chitinophagales bacterium]